MIAFDTNILVHVHRHDSPVHAAASRALQDALAGAEPVGFCMPVLHEFVSVVTNRRLFGDPTSIDAAFRQLDTWLASPVASVLRESPRHLATLQAIMVAGDVTGGGVHDARIAAICLDHGVREFNTADRDFTRFPGLRTRNPLAM